MGHPAAGNGLFDRCPALVGQLPARTPTDAPVVKMDDFPGLSKPGLWLRIR